MAEAADYVEGCLAGVFQDAEMLYRFQMLAVEVEPAQKVDDLLRLRGGVDKTDRPAAVPLSKHHQCKSPGAVQIVDFREVHGKGRRGQAGQSGLELPVHCFQVLQRYPARKGQEDFPLYFT